MSHNSATGVARGALSGFIVMTMLCAFPHDANAQLRSLHAIRYVTLAPPPSGLEKLHQDLSAFWRQRTKLVEPPETLEERLARGEKFESFPALWIDSRARAARCRLRADLPQPRFTGLECVDYAGEYVGVVRFSTADELLRWVRLADSYNQPAATPLTSVRSLLSGQSRRPSVSAKDVEFLKTLLRTDGTFQVLESDDGMSVGERASLVYFDLNLNAYGVNGRAFARLMLKDQFGNAVRVFDIQRPRSGEETIRHLLHELLKARLEDEEIYRVPRSRF